MQKTAKQETSISEKISLPGADPGFCEGGFEGGFVNSLKGTFEQK